MPSMILNDAKVELTLQSQQTLGALAQALVPMIATKQSLVPSIGAVIAQGLSKGIAPTDPPIQAPLWLLHEMGVRALTVPAGGEGGSIDKLLCDEERTRDQSDPYSQGNMATGRALAVALANIATRSFMLNGERLEVKLLTRDKMEPAIQAVVDMRRLNEPIHITTTRALASLIAAGVAMTDERVDAVVSLISDLGVSGITIDVATSTITFDGFFSEENSAASAYLQGGGVQGVLVTRQRVRHLNSQMQKGSNGATAEVAREASRQPNRSFVKARRRR